MGVRITTDEDKAALFDSVTGFAFGPTFDNSDDAQEFLAYLQSFGEDGRELTPVALASRYDAWLVVEPLESEPFDMSGATRGAER